jgi:hypothetical protein
MTHPDLDVRRIREAFDRDLSGYQAPSDFPERVRQGGLRRARQRRVRRMTGAGAVACAAAVAIAAASLRRVGGQSHADRVRRGQR